MKCQVCKIKEAELNSIVCSDNCDEIRLKIITMSDKYTPVNGCENCLEDLGQGCTSECDKEYKKSYEFVSDMYSLIKLVRK